MKITEFRDINYFESFLVFIDRNHVITLNKIILFVDIIIYGNLISLYEILGAEWGRYYNGLTCDHYSRSLFLYRHDHRLTNSDSVSYTTLWSTTKQ